MATTDPSRIAAELQIWQIGVLIFLSIVVLQAIIYTILYRRASIDEAVVRTGIWDAQVAVTTGLFALPFVHAVKRVRLTESTITLDFADQHAIRWQGQERFTGTIILSVQVPAENPSLVLNAARTFRDTGDREELTAVLEGAYRSTCRDVVRGIKRITFDIEPAAIEVRLTQSLDIVSTAFGLRVRAVHMYDNVVDTNRMRSTIARFDHITREDGIAGLEGIVTGEASSYGGADDDDEPTGFDDH